MISRMPENEGSLLSPVPQAVNIHEDGFALSPVVWLVTGMDTPPAALLQVETALYHAGVKEVEIRSTPPEGGIAATAMPVVIYMGKFLENQTVSDALDLLGATTAEGFHAEGYVLAAGSTNSGTHMIVLAGMDENGIFYASQTFSQLIFKKDPLGWIPSVTVYDWPSMPVRGVIEGFYGPPWSHEERLNQFSFYSKHKMNAYVYAPKDDPYHREKWRTPYPQDKMAEIKQLVDAAKRNHITFTFAISPGNSITFSDDSEFQKLINKAQAVWDIGVRSFALYLDDIDPALRFPKDKEKFGGDHNPSAAAQAFLLNRFNEEFIKTHPGAKPLITVPTEYYEEGTSPYRERFAALVQPDIIVQWTGIGVVAPSIRVKDAQCIHGIFQHPLLIWDNYPVNDFDRNRLFLAPLYGRDAELYKETEIIGITANPMNEAEASKIPLYTMAEYMWNPTGYEPEESLQKSLLEFSGGREMNALRLFVESCYGSLLNNHKEPLSLKLEPLMDAFWKQKEKRAIGAEANELLHQFLELKNVPNQLQQLGNSNFLRETEPYLIKLSLYGAAGEAAVQLVLMEKEGDASQADTQRVILESLVEKLVSIPKKLSLSAMNSFINRVLGHDALNEGTKADSPAPTIY
ncbi:beta-N-acetylhexosaminidase family protein [Fictibacillus fluitans]|uniref:Beta-N-acetylglucosaminidase domain-containing protein n=1 Tax=Fictibacillus fluitans TaxID=3058422 RepID=A0ABT8HVV1_9BACL|nr:beta-N-acetylglucosaminidase domain-containing protein [Fictibacillus sp. NE201]MDN4524909.1 beta-N-acetylglucosaminidase domain-containing protein [Fictibacillus sp. NE201]